MRLMPALGLSSVMALAALPASAASPPAGASVAAPARATAGLPATLNIPPFRMRYRVLRDGWHLGNATFTLQPAEDGTWVFKSRASASGLAALFVHSTFSEHSHFTLHDHQLRPLGYTYTDSGSPSHDESVRFDWAAGQALDTKGGKTRQIPLAPGILDRLTVQLALSRQLAAGLPLPATWAVITGGELKHYHLRHKGKDLLATPAGDFDTVIVSREDPKSRRSTTFWLSPKYGWLPVKMQQKEPGKATVTFVLSKLTWLHP